MSVTVEKCLEAWTNSLKQMNAKVDIVFFGDSLIYYGDFTSIFPDMIVCNLGLRGDTLKGLTNRAGQVKLLNPKTVYLMAGINDVASYTVIEFREQYESLLKTLIEQNHTTELIVFGMLPVNDVEFTISCNNELIARCNMEIASLCFKHDVRYVDVHAVFECFGILPKEMTTDGIHLSLKGYDKWYKTLNT